jgi:hypothetical protein
MARVQMQLFGLFKPTMTDTDRFNTVIDQYVAKLYANFPLPESGREVVRGIVQSVIINQWHNNILYQLSYEMRVWRTHDEKIKQKPLLDICSMSHEEAAREVFKRMPGGYSFNVKKSFASAEELLEYHKERAMQDVLSYCKCRIEEPLCNPQFEQYENEWKDFFIKAMRAIYKTEP